MKYETTVGFADPSPRTAFARRALAALSALVLGTAVALALGLIVVNGVAMVGTGIPVLLVAWAASIGLIVLLPFLVVRVIASVFGALNV